MHEGDGQLYRLLAVYTIRLDLLQCSIKEVGHRFREKRELHFFKYGTHEGEEG